MTIRQLSINNMTKAFILWEKRYRKNPDEFYSEVHRLLKTTPKSYGEACATYFTGLLDELREQGKIK
jgi:hypothetical protein